MTFSAEEQFALQLDSEDPLRHFRQKFHLPLGKDDRPLIYFAGNSLGLMPKAARAIVEEELDNWAKLGVDAHHATGTPWYTYQEARRSIRSGDPRRCELFHGSTVRCRQNHCCSTGTGHRRWVRPCPCHWERATLTSRLERRFRCLVFIQISQRRSRRSRRSIRA